MTNGQAISKLKHATPYLDTQEWREAFNLSINALEKQVPKICDTDKSPQSDSWMLDDVFICPNCGGFIGWISECSAEEYQIDFCSHCGQAIDWSEE